ncbi:MAG: VWA domain-containing protein [Actinomycetota bacterium]
MTFASPVFLWGLLLVPLAVTLQLLVHRRRARYTIRYTNLDVLRSVLPRAAPWRRWLPIGLYVLALSALLLGSARPQATVLVPRQRATVVLSIDTSGSMEATDVRPTRLAAAQVAARSFLEQLPEEFQVGLVTFSERAHVLAQPTTDRTAVRDAIGSLSPQGGTAMGDALATALALNHETSGSAGSLPPSSTPDRDRTGDRRPLDAVLLLSDGFNTTGRIQPLEAAETARELQIPTFTIALGTPDGVVEGEDALGRPRLIRVPPDYDTLREMADTTGGDYFTAPTEDDLRRIYDTLGSRIGFVKDRREVTAAFAAAALVLAGLAGGLSLAWTGRLP